MQLGPETVSLFVGLLSGLIGSLLTYWSQRPKIKSEARTEAEKADDIVFMRLTHELERRDDRIEQLEARLAEEISKRVTEAAEMSKERVRLASEMSEVRRSFDNERELRRQIEAKLAEEQGLRRSLEQRVANQGEKIKKQEEQIKELQSENNSLHNQNRELARRLDTQQLNQK